jgi:hypothetical protein
LESLDEFAAYRKAALLPKGHLHPLIASKVYPAFRRGEYDTAVFQAFSEVEIAVRLAGNFPDDLSGKELMREAFRPENPKSGVKPGPLSDPDATGVGQDMKVALFSDAIGIYKKHWHYRNVPTDIYDSFAIMLASDLLLVVDRLAPRRSSSVAREGAASNPATAWGRPLSASLLRFVAICRKYLVRPLRGY